MKNKELKLDLIKIVNEHSQKIKNQKRISKIGYILTHLAIAGVIVGIMFGTASDMDEHQVIIIEKETESIIQPKKEVKITELSMPLVDKPDIKPVETPQVKQSYDYETDLIARCVMAEVGGNNCENCERLVIDTILNRLENINFSNTVTGIIFDPVAFETYSNKSIFKVTPTNRIIKLIHQERKKRTYSDVLAFKENEYHNFGYPICNCHNAYFSGI